jgi:hypothetical protein
LHEFLAFLQRIKRNQQKNKKASMENGIHRPFPLHESNVVVGDTIAKVHTAILGRINNRIEGIP